MLLSVTHFNCSAMTLAARQNSQGNVNAPARRGEKTVRVETQRNDSFSTISFELFDGHTTPVGEHKPQAACVHGPPSPRHRLTDGPYLPPRAAILPRLLEQAVILYEAIFSAVGDAVAGVSVQQLVGGALRHVRRVDSDSVLPPRPDLKFPNLCNAEA